VQTWFKILIGATVVGAAVNIFDGDSVTTSYIKEFDVPSGSWCLSDESPGIEKPAVSLQSRSRD